MVIKETASDRVFNAVNTLLLTIVLLIVAYPLYFIIIASFSNPDLVNTGKVLFLPRELSVEGYKMVFNFTDLWLGYRNTLIYAVFGTLINLAVTLPAAYTLSRKDFRWKGFFVTFFMIPMFFGGGLIPTYMLMTRTLHFNDTIWAILIPGATSMMQMVVARTFFQSTIPDELRESAEIDGASNFRVFFTIVIPLSTAIIAVQGLQSAIGQWNAFFNAFLYLSDRGGRNLQPLSLILRRILVIAQASTVAEEFMQDQMNYVERLRRVEQIKYAMIIVSVIPILIAYPFIQRYFVKGVMIGALKG
ncbi:sugar ABC transporter permease [Clostridia bacterium]|nr:sugar ABC transporter permease [Clostridia bacterium]